jgi:PAS domain S-box-containing protein
MFIDDELYRCLLENASDSVTIRTGEGWIIEANPAACELLGYGYDELLTKNFMDLISPDCHDSLFKISETLLGEGLVDYETFFVRGDGSRFRAKVRCVRIESEGRDVVMCISRDISKRKHLELKLNDTRMKYQLMVETANEGIVTADAVQRINYVNQKTVDMLGYPVDEMIGLNLIELIYKDDLLDYDKRVDNRKNNIAECFERRFIHKDGSVRWMIVSVTPLMDNGKFVGSFAMLTDITDMKSAELALRDSEEKYRLVVETAAEAIIILDMDGVVVDVNNKVLEIGKLKRELVVGREFTILLPKFGINGEEAFKLFKSDLEGRHQDEEKVWTARIEGVEYHFIAHISNITRDGVVKGMSVILEDITNRLNTEVKLKDSLREKEVLLKEIHHRVKNNLQIISSLLSLQSDYIVNEHDQQIFLDSQSRIKSMAMVHEQLYQSADLSSINFENYLNNLVGHLFNSFKIDPESIQFDLNVENIMFGVNTAIPLGLMINELLTNSLKHAFPCLIKGQVSLTDYAPVLSENTGITGDYCSISLNLSFNEGKYVLIVEDNGIGLPRDLNYQETGTLGFQLINSLVKQLDGVIRLDRSSGTKFIIEFKV